MTVWKTMLIATYWMVTAIAFQKSSSLKIAV